MSMLQNSCNTVSNEHAGKQLSQGGYTVSNIQRPNPKKNMVYGTHKVLIYIEHHTVCPLVGIGTPPPLQPQASVPSPPDQRVGGYTRLRLKGWGSPNSHDRRNAQHSAYSVMGPYAGVDYNLTLCRLQHIYHGQPYAIELAFTLCRSRHCPPVSDLGFCLTVWACQSK